MTYEDYIMAEKLRELAKGAGFHIGYSAVQRRIELWRESQAYCLATVEEAVAFLYGWDSRAKAEER